MQILFVPITTLLVLLTSPLPTLAGPRSQPLAIVRLIEPSNIPLVENTIQAEQMPELMGYFGEHFSGVGIRFSPVVFSEAPHPCPEFQQYGYSVMLPDCLIPHASAIWRKRNFNVYYLLPPAWGPGFFSLGGASKAICRKRRGMRLAWGNGLSFNLPASATVMAHEIGHLLGARHDDGNANLMHSLIARFALDGVTTPINKAAKRQIRRCKA